ncbi:MAG: hypothetical protein SXQ77_01550 [Halobacteria archaeon]|nr:hypothetical protein [Halobacteria archaeon]
MIGKNILANADFPIQNPDKVAYTVLTIVILAIYVLVVANVV